MRLPKDEDGEREEASLRQRARQIQDLNQNIAERELDLRQVFEGAAVGIAVADASRRLEHVNPAFSRLLGYSPEALRGVDFSRLTHPEDRGDTEELYRELSAGRRDSFVLEKRYLNPQRGVVWARVSVSLLRAGEKQPQRIIAVAEDITRQMSAQAEALENRRLMDFAGSMARVGGWELDLATGVARGSDVVCDIHEMPHGTEISLEEWLNFCVPEWREIAANVIRHALDTGTPFDLELEILTAWQRRVWVRSIGEVVRDESGKVCGLRGAFQDISPLKASEQAAREREAAFHHLAESMPHIVWGASPDAAVDYANSKLGEYCGAPVPELLGDAWLSVIHPDDRDDVSAAWAQAVATGDPYRIEFRIRRYDGQYRWHLVQAQPVRATDGQVMRWYGSASDVHQRRLIEERAQSLANRLTTTLESVTDAVYTVDHNWRFTFLNGRAERVLETPRENLLGRNLWEVMPDAAGGEIEEIYAKAVSTGEPAHFEIYFAPLERWFSVHAYPSQEGLAVFFRDVTAERAAAEELRIAQERFRIVARVTSDAIWDWNFLTDEIWWSGGIEDSFGHRLETLEVDSRSWTSRIHPQDRERVEQGIHAAIDSDAEAWQDEYRFRRGDGSYAHVLDRGFIVRDEGGKPLQMVGAMSDETQHVQAVARLKEQADLLDRAQDAILVRDLDNRIVFWNAGAERIYGWSREEALGRLKRELLHTAPASFDEAMRLVLEYGEWAGELEHQTKAGDLITVESRWSLVRDDDGEPQRILAINTDVTERKRLIEQFLRAQRLESIGTLAGGIAHDLNNVLSPILTSIELLKLDEDSAEKQEILETIEASARRGADMVQQVLGFARGVKVAQVIVDLRQIIGDLAGVIRDSFPKSISFRSTVDDELWPLRGDATQIHQVLLNLFVNARDAMPNGGRLEMTAENVTLDERYDAMGRQAWAERHICITVADSGCGMSADVLDKVFDPFFTTKGVGEGTGLGLSTVAAIIKSHGGFVQMHSEPGKGTTVRIYFPAATDAAVPEPPCSSRPRHGNGELVLVVDDDRAVREITRFSLQAFGYRVVTAQDSAEAVAVYNKLGDEIAVVLTDIMMPVMDGVATISALRDLDPAVKIIAASRGGANSDVTRIADQGVQHFLPKPYSVAALMNLLHRVLEGK